MEKRIRLHTTVEVCSYRSSKLITCDVHVYTLAKTIKIYIKQGNEISNGTFHMQKWGQSEVVSLTPSLVCTCTCMCVSGFRTPKQSQNLHVLAQIKHKNN